jgi:hypothetical protein
MKIQVSDLTETELEQRIKSLKISYLAVFLFGGALAIISQFLKSETLLPFIYLVALLTALPALTKLISLKRIHSMRAGTIEVSENKVRLLFGKNVIEIDRSKCIELIVFKSADHLNFLKKDRALVQLAYHGEMNCRKGMLIKDVSLLNLDKSLDPVKAELKIAVVNSGFFERPNFLT